MINVFLRGSLSMSSVGPWGGFPIPSPPQVRYRLEGYRLGGFQAPIRLPLKLDR